jgi:hypothetical protein
MFGVDIGTWLVLLLGIILGGVLFSATFRDRFMRQLRKFFMGVSEGADNLNRHYDGRGPKPRKEEPKPEAKKKRNAADVHYHIHVGETADRENDEEKDWR